MNKKVEQAKSRVADCGRTGGYVLILGEGLIILAAFVDSHQIKTIHTGWAIPQLDSMRQLKYRKAPSPSNAAFEDYRVRWRNKGKGQI